MNSRPCPQCDLPMAVGEGRTPEGQRFRSFTCINRRCPLFNAKVEQQILDEE